MEESGLLKCGEKDIKCLIPSDVIRETACYDADVRVFYGVRPMIGGDEIVSEARGSIGFGDGSFLRRPMFLESGP